MVTILQLANIKKKKSYKKRFVKGTKIFLKMKNEKKGNVIANDIKTFPNMKNKCSLDIGKIIIKCGKILRNNVQTYIKG